MCVCVFVIKNRKIVKICFRNSRKYRVPKNHLIRHAINDLNN